MPLTIVRNQDEPRLDELLDLDLSRVQAQWEQRLEQLVADYQRIRVRQHRRLVEQVRDIIDSGDIAALLDLDVPTGDAQELLLDAMVDMAEAAAVEQAREAQAQGVTIEPMVPTTDVFAPIAIVAAGLLAFEDAASAGRETIRVDGAGDTALRVSTHLSNLSDAYPRLQLGAALTGAQNAGRVATLRSAPEAAYYASEILDTNTCTNCRFVDGKWLGNDLDDVERLYPNGGYVECLGRQRCRGTVVALWRPEQVAS